MSLIVPVASESRILRTLVNHTSLGFADSNLYLHLYYTDSSFNNTATIDDFTEIMVSTADYYPIELEHQTWTLDTSNGVSTVSYVEQTFTFTGSLATDINGYYVTNTESTPQLLYFERFSNAYSIDADGDKIKITLNLSLD